MTISKKMPKHKKGCAFLEDPDQLCTCNAKYLGKPFAHWQTRAQELVMDTLLRGVYQYQDPDELFCLPRHLASRKLFQLAYSVDPAILRKTADEHTRCAAGFVSIMAEITEGKWLPYFDPATCGLPDKRKA